MRCVAISAATALLVVGGAAFAAEAETAPPQAEVGVQLFEPAFFARFAPVNALDMVRRVPGFSIDDGDSGVRGFGGAAGNVLIDGARPSTKNTGLGEILARIPAASVARIELRDGASAGGADAGGQALVVNVVRKAQTTASGSYELEVHRHGNGFLQPELELSWAQQLGPVALTLGADGAFDEYSNLSGREDVRDAAGRLLEGGRNADKRTRWSGELSAAGEARLGATKVRANASYSRSERNRVFSHAAFAGSRFIRLDDGEDGFEKTGLELGADLERAFGPVTGKLVLLASDQTDDDVFLAGFNAPGAVQTYDLFTADRDIGERIVRVSLSGARGPHALEAGVEGALNTLDARSRLFEGSVGAFRPIAQGIETTAVEEERVEAFLADSWTISPDLTVEVGFKAEWSTIAQSGDGANRRSFIYPKPRVALTWRPRAGWTVRAKAERILGQLNFFDFVSSAEVGDGNNREGNPDLQPSQTWLYEAGIERRFGARGVVGLTLVREEIEDVVALVPIGAGEGVGNIPRGSRWGFDTDWTIPLDSLGIPGGEFGLDWRWRESELVDPLTRATRAFSGWDGRNLEARFRQDVPGAQFAWGVWGWRGDRRFEYRRTQTFDHPQNENWGVWVETKRFAGLSIEAGLESPEGQTFRRIRTTYSGDRATGRVDRVQYRERSLDGRFYLSVRGAL
jgi:hypothetical protein